MAPRAICFALVAGKRATGVSPCSRCACGSASAASPIAAHKIGPGRMRKFGRPPNGTGVWCGAPSVVADRWARHKVIVEGAVVSGPDAAVRIKLPPTAALVCWQQRDWFPALGRLRVVSRHGAGLAYHRRGRGLRRRLVGLQPLRKWLWPAPRKVRATAISVWHGRRQPTVTAGASSTYLRLSKMVAPISCSAWLLIERSMPLRSRSSDTAVNEMSVMITR